MRDERVTLEKHAAAYVAPVLFGKVLKGHL
jgi:hypothetical protein